MTFAKLLSLLDWLFIPKKLAVHRSLVPGFLTGGAGGAATAAAPDAIEGVTDTLFPVPDPPDSPDFQNLADQTAYNDLEATRSATASNRPDQFTPFGSSIWSQDPDNPDSWSNTVSLSPEQQQLFDTNQMTSQQMADMGLSGINAASSIFDNPFEVGEFSGAREEVKNSMLARVETDIGRDRDSLHDNLIAKGIPENSEAYRRAMEQIDRKETDARQQVEINATDQALKERQRSVTESLLERQTPLNELNAFRTGNQVSSPNFNPFSNQQTTQGADALGAGIAQSNYDLGIYNADVAGRNAVTGGLFDFGAAYASRP